MSYTVYVKIYLLRNFRASHLVSSIPHVFVKSAFTVLLFTLSFLG